MDKTTEGTIFTHFIRSLKEIETHLMMGRIDPDEGEPTCNSRSLPTHWREVFHMARIAPALLSCLGECAALIEEDYLPTLARENMDGLGANQDRAHLDMVRNLLGYSDHVMSVAVTGVKPDHELLH